MEAPNWNQYYGIGQGGAQVFQGNPALDALKQRIAKQDAIRQQEQQQYMDNLGKINYKGAAAGDLPLLQQKYQDILDTHQKLRSASDQKQRQALLLKQQQQMQDALLSASQSVENNKHIQSVAELPLNPNVQLAEGFADHLKNITGMPTLGEAGTGFQKSISDVSNFFEKPYDLNKIYNDAFKSVTNTSTNTGKPEYDRTTGLYRTPTNTTVAASKDDFANRLIAQLHGNPHAARGLMDQYGTKDIGEAVKAAVNEQWPILSKQLGTDTKYSAPFQSEAQRKSLTPYQQQELELRKMQIAKTAAATNTPTYAQDLAARIQSQGTANAALDEINAMATSNPAFKKSVGYKKRPDGSIDIWLPKKYKYNPKEADPSIPNSGRIPIQDIQHFHLDPKNQQLLLQNVGAIVSELDPKGTSAKMLTPGGKGHVGGGTAQQYIIHGKSYGYDAVSKAAKASGMTVDEYLKELNK